MEDRQAVHFSARPLAGLIDIMETRESDAGFRNKG